MKTQTLKITILFLSFMMATDVMAKFQYSGKISNIYIDSEISSNKAVIHVKLFGLFPSLLIPDCDGNSFFRLKNDAFFFDEMYSLLLSAKFNGQNVKLNVSGTAPDACFIDNVEID